MKAMLRFLVGAAAALAALFAPPAFAAEPPSPRPQPLLEIDQKMPEGVEPGMPFEIEIVVRNTGAAAADGVTVTDQLPTGYDLLGVAPTPERTANGLVWRIAKLAPEEHVTLRVRLASKAGAPAAPPRNAVDATFQARASSVCTSPLTQPDLTLTVPPPDAVFTGQTTTFRIVIGNNGPGAARNVTLHAVLGEGLSNPKGSDLEADVGGLAPGESRVVTLPATAARSGDLRGSFSVRAPGAAPVQREVLCRAEDDRLNVTAAGPTVLHSEFTGLFSAAASNDGPTPARQVVLTATLPDGLVFVRGTDNATYNAATRTVTWDLGDLQPGERREVMWNGTAQGAGDLQAQVRLTTGSQTRREVAWTTRVIGEAAKPTPAGVVAVTPGE